MSASDHTHDDLPARYAQDETAPERHYHPAAEAELRVLDMGGDLVARVASRDDPGTEAEILVPEASLDVICDLSEMR